MIFDFFSHGDHLGSASWITDYRGMPIQYMHYLPYGQFYFGGGCPIQNGKTANALFIGTSEYRSIFYEIANGSTHGIIPVEMQDYMFHIGTTFCTYHVNGSMVVIAFALYDSLSDPNYWKENNYKTKGIDLTDGLGPNLELGGTPYNYIPTVFVIR